MNKHSLSAEARRKTILSIVLGVKIGRAHV